MREIKFRAWDKISKCMRYHAENTLVTILYNPDFNVMQYTGLKDKKGVEIYEGDILQGEFNHEEPYEVYWHKECAEFSNLHGCNNSEVIGNIYENKDLLNSKG